MTKHLESITDESKRQDFNRELYFLSRRILAKKKQINELQELHSVIKRHDSKKQSNGAIDKPIVSLNSKRVLSKCVSNEYLPKWV